MDKIRSGYWTSPIIKTGKGWMYLTVNIDLFHRKVVGWSMSDTLGRAETIIPAWMMVIRSNNIADGLVFHSDRAHNILVMILPMSLKSIMV